MTHWFNKTAIPPNLAYSHTFKNILMKKTLLGLLSLLIFTLPLQSNADSQHTILVFGDSLSAAYGLQQSQGWAALLQKKLQTEKLNPPAAKLNAPVDKLNAKAQTHFSTWQVINASVSGETTSGGLSRLKAALSKTQPNIVILELGANDGLRGLPIKNMQSNLEAMIKLSQQAGAEVLLIGMKIPPNYGATYTNGFSETYTTLSKQYNTALVPFLLQKVAANPALIQADGLHPNAIAQPMLLETIWPYLLPLLKD